MSTDNNVTEQKIVVNQNNSILALKRLFYLQSKNKSAFSEKVLENGVKDYSIRKPLGEGIVKKCPFDVPMCFAPNGALKNRENVERKKPWEKYPELYKEATQGEITNRTLRHTLNKWVKNLGNVCVKDNNGLNFFESNAKGTARYNKRNYWAIHDFCKAQDSFGKQAYFCTFTCKYDIKKDNIIEKWQQFTNEVNLILKKLSALYGVEYVLVKESFLSGYPHAHVILYVKDFFNSDKQRYLRSKKYSVVVDGKLKRLLNKFFTMGYTELVRNTKKGTANYLSKYISKNETNGLKHLSNKKKWTNADRKQVLTTFMPILANVRQFQKSVKISDNHNEKFNFEDFTLRNKSENGVFEDIIQKSLFLSNADFIKKCRSRDYLIALCNNLPKCIQKQICILSNRTLWKFTNEPINKINAESNEYKNVIFRKAKCLNCSECVYSHFLAELLTKNDKHFHKERVKNIIPTEMSESLVSDVLQSMDKEDSKSIYSKEIEVFNTSKEKAEQIIKSLKIDTYKEDKQRTERLIMLLNQKLSKKNLDLQVEDMLKYAIDSGVKLIDNNVNGAKKEFIKMGVSNGTEQMLF